MNLENVIDISEAPKENDAFRYYVIIDTESHFALFADFCYYGQFMLGEMGRFSGVIRFN